VPEGVWIAVRRAPHEKRDAMFADGQTLRYPREQLEQIHWYALRTRYRHEKRTHDFLQAAGHESFAAAAQVEREWADRIRQVQMPLFAGYIFVRIDLGRIGEVLRCPGAVDVVRTAGIPSPVREDELDSVMRMVRGTSQTKQPPQEVDYLAPGDPVRIERGPFEGMAGRLLEMRGQSRVAVRLDTLQLARAVSVDRGCLVRLAG
jgi:transcription antitermination factor NusG